MRSRFIIFVFSFVIVFAVAGNTMSSFKRLLGDSADSITSVDTAKLKDLPDSLLNDSVINPVDTLDSLHQAIYLRNKAIDDSISLDSLNRKKKNGIDAPVKYTADDSLVYFAGNKKAHLYGSSNVKYENMDLTSEKISIAMDSSLVRATGAFDTAKKAKMGTPVFKMGSDQYESDTMAFNFKTKKGLISQVYTAQEDGFLTSERSKRDSVGNLYLRHGRYTTCDEEHPDFYLALTRARVRPGKDVVFGPAYLVVQDVPLPLAIPYGFFPFSKSYSSGFIMPTYGDETSRGFYLRDGGYYFAMSDKWDLKLLGEIYTKGSWGFTATSNYRKRYKYNGSFLFSYQDTRTGDQGMSDYEKQTSYKLIWSHTQDSKANPYRSLSAKVNFASQSYERNNLTAHYDVSRLAQSTRSSSVNFGTSFSSINMTLNATTSLTQRIQDSTVEMSLPELSWSVSKFYPLKRKKAAGDQRWYEKIGVKYSGRLYNSISTKEDKLFKSNLMKDWQNGMKHSLTTDATFQVLKYINVTPSVDFNDRMFSKKIMQNWDETKNQVVRDTIAGFYNVYDWDMSVSANTTLYGFFVPNRKIFGDKIQAIRHVLKPSVTYSYAPDFGAGRYGYYSSYTNADGSTVDYSPYSGLGLDVPSSGKRGNISFSLENNLEMKIKSEKDTTGFKKISLIDRLKLTTGYNFAAKTRPWNDLGVDLNLKFSEKVHFNINTTFKTYGYDLKTVNGVETVTQSEKTEWSRGRFGIWSGTTQSLSYTIDPNTIKKLFGKDDDKDKDKKKKKDSDDDDDVEGLEANEDPVMKKGRQKGRNEGGKAETDEDGYLKFSMPWSLSLSYSVSILENTSGTFNKNTMRYPYKLTQTFNCSGHVSLSSGWTISFQSGYDFDRHKLSATSANLSRDLHCFSMSCSVCIAPYTSYDFEFRCNASTLTDLLRYPKRSSYSNSVKWY